MDIYIYIYIYIYGSNFIIDRFVFGFFGLQVCNSLLCGSQIYKTYSTV